MDKTRFRKPKNPIRYPLVAMMVALYVAVLYSNLITIVIAAVFVISVTVFQLYSSAAWALYHVISVVEDVEDGAEALENAEELVKGRRHHGFMINLLFNLVFLVIFLGGWVMFGDEGLVKNLTVYGLLFVNTASLGGICWSVAYTVLYFECKKQRGEEIDMLGNFQYTKLTSEKQGGDAT